MKKFEIGEILYGYCNGYFGRDSYIDKTVENYGKDWVVCRDEYNEVHFAEFCDNKEFWELMKEWRDKDHE